MANHFARFTALIVLVACDPEPGAGAGDGKAASQGVSTPRAAEAAVPVAVDPPVAGAANPAPVADAPSAFVSCLLACDAGRMSHAQRATCRYNCEGPADGGGSGPPSGGVETDPVASVARCMGRCPANGGEPCMRACKDAVVASPATPSAAALDELGTCIASCHADKQMSATNLATCELNCAETARVAGPAQGAGK
jgi:hypothetical protein